MRKWQERRSRGERVAEFMGDNLNGDTIESARVGGTIVLVLVSGIMPEGIKRPVKVVLRLLHLWSPS